MTKNVGPRTNNDTRTISKGLVVTEKGVEIATISMSVTTLRGFQADNIEHLVKSIAEGSRLFYLEVGNALKREP